MSGTDQLAGARLAQASRPSTIPPGGMVPAIPVKGKIAVRLAWRAGSVVQAGERVAAVPVFGGGLTTPT